MMLKRLFFIWGPVVIWCGVIFTLSSIPTLPKVSFVWWDFVLKKTAHVTEYAILFFLTWRAIRLNFKLSALDKKIILAIFIFCLLYAVSDEFHQSFVIGRTPTVRDVGFDTLGMTLSWYLLKKQYIRPEVLAKWKLW